jgi:hypothetical protein
MEQLDLLYDGVRDAGDGASLRVRPASARLDALLAERGRLMKRVALKRKDLERLRAGIAELGALVNGRVHPILEQTARLDAEVHALFAELLRPGRLSRRDRKGVMGVFDELREAGVLSADGLAGAPGGEEPRGDAPGEGRAGSASDAPGHGPDASSRPPSPSRVAGAIRDIYRKLATRIHPDLAEAEGDRAARTEAMKEVTRAYHEGDLARLLEIERAWGAGALVASGPDDLERLCATIERTNEELRAQLRTLARELQELRRSDAGTGHAQAPRLAREHGGDLGSALEAQARSELEELRRLRDFVKRMRDGQMSIEEFLAGPDAADAAQAFEEVMDLLAMALAEEGPPRRRKKRRSRRR